jgi:23S rRNA (adenine2030-N6)-methyltransferase
MLSYQHGYHAGNAADVVKHALLAWMLDYLTQKDKPLSYIETHAGRGLYDVTGAQAQKTGEAAAGIGRLEGGFAPGHPYRRVLAQVRGAYGAGAYPGSPLIAALMLRAGDRVDLAERHPGEHAALADLFDGWDAGQGPRVRVRFEDGFAMARSLAPPEPRRGLMLVDPSYETAGDYDDMPGFLARIARVWNVGILALWYPILREARHGAMLTALAAAHPGAARIEARFPPARDGHRMVGTGLFVINPPWGLAEEAARIAGRLTPGP